MSSKAEAIKPILLNSRDGYRLIPVNHKNTIHSHFIFPLLRSAEARGFSVAEILADADLSIDVLDQSLARFTPEQYTKIVKKLWSLFGDEVLGLGSEIVPFGTFELMCDVSMHAHTLQGEIAGQEDA